MITKRPGQDPITIRSKVKRRFRRLFPKDPKKFKLVTTLLAAFIITVVNLVLFFTGRYMPIELAMFDLRTTLSNQFWPKTIGDAPTDNVVIVDLSQESIDHYSSEFGWPWPRNKYCTLMRKLKDAGAKVIIFDVIFAKHIRNDEKHIQEDREFADCARDLGNVMFVCASVTEYDPASVPSQMPEFYARHQINVINKDDVKIADRGWGVFPMEWLASSTAAMPDDRLEPDKDGINRNYPLVTKVRGIYFPTPATAVIMKLQNTNEITFEGGKAKIGKYEFRVDDYGRFTLKYYHPLKKVDGGSYHKGIRTEHYYQLESLKDMGELEKIVKDRIVILGSSAPGLKDVVAAPGNEVEPVVEIHSTAICNIIGQDWIHKVGAISNIFLLGIYVFGLFILFRYAKSSFLSGFLRNAIVWVHISVGFLIFHRGIWIDIAAPGFAILSAYATAMAMNFAAERSEKLQVRKAFESVADQTIVKRMISGMQTTTTGTGLAEQRYVTFVSIDMISLSAASDSLKISKMGPLAKEFFNTVVREVMANDGEVERYLGGAFIISWGGPFDQPHHAYLACKTGLDLRKHLSDFETRIKAELGLEIAPRIGIASGVMMMSQRDETSRIGYFIVSEGTSLASQFRAANRIFGTKVLITENTYDLTLTSPLPDSVAEQTLPVVREIGMVKVKDKKDPVRLYELVSLNNEDQNLPLIKEHSAAVQLLRDGKIQDAIIQFRKIAEERRDPLAGSIADLLSERKYELKGVEPVFVIDTQ